MNLKALVLSAAFLGTTLFGQDTTSYSSNCPDALKLYSIEEMHTAGVGIVDLNRNGKVDIGDALFVGEDKNMDGNSDVVYIHQIIKLDDCDIDLNPAEAWFDMDYDGIFDTKIPAPTLKQIYKEDEDKREYSGNRT